MASMETIAESFKALSDPTRIRIIHLLTTGELCVCDIIAGLDLPQSTVSRHLSLLKSAGWILSGRRGKWIYYRLNEDIPDRRIILEHIKPLLARTREGSKDMKLLQQHLRAKSRAERCPRS